ncbi:cytochrome P450 family protein [Amycolatopsis japonica]|uniref:hypothetical protein n=1 Tax=Amycolatopsis japonica TaxID=208439 RepID=UPI0037F94329
MTSDFAPPAEPADRVGRMWRRSGELPPALPQPYVDLLVFADGSLWLTGPETEARTGNLAEPLTGLRLRPGACASVLGPSRWPDFVRWTEAITSFFGTFTADESRQAAFHEAISELGDYFREEFTRPTGIIATLPASDLTEDELIDFCALLLINGHETTKTCS